MNTPCGFWVNSERNVKMHFSRANLIALCPSELSILNYIRKIQQDAVTLIFKLETWNKKHLVCFGTYFVVISEHLSINDIFKEIQGQGHLLKFSWSGELVNRKCYKNVVNTKVVGLNMNYPPVFIWSWSDQY